MITRALSVLTQRTTDNFRVARNVGTKIVKKERWLRERGTANSRDLGNHV